MSLYTCKVLTESGEVHVGESVSSSAAELKRSLLEQGFLVQNINRKKQFSLPVVKNRQTVSSDEFLVFNQELIALLKAGLTIPESLSLIQEQSDSCPVHMSATSALSFSTPFFKKPPETGWHLFTF